MLREVGAHGLEHFRKHRRRRAVIEVNPPHGKPSQLPFYAAESQPALGEVAPEVRRVNFACVTAERKKSNPKGAKKRRQEAEPGRHRFRSHTWRRRKSAPGTRSDADSQEEKVPTKIRLLIRRHLRPLLRYRKIHGHVSVRGNTHLLGPLHRIREHRTLHPRLRHHVVQLPVSHHLPALMPRLDLILSGRNIG